MAFGERLVQALEVLLREESEVHERYHKLVELEQKAITKLQTDQVLRYTEQREKLYNKMEELHEKRLSILKDQAIEELHATSKTKLTDLIKRHATPGEQRRLLPLAKRLKQAVQGSKRSSSELGQILNFTLGLINGSISLLWSATQNITRAYNSRGHLKEYHQPGKSGTLKRV